MATSRSGMPVSGQTIQWLMRGGLIPADSESLHLPQLVASNQLVAKDSITAPTVAAHSKCMASGLTTFIHLSTQRNDELLPDQGRDVNATAATGCCCGGERTLLKPR